jgi:hypothetical protein
MSENKSLIIAGLQEIDYLELQEQLPPDTIRQLPKPPRASGQHGTLDPISAVVILTVAAIHALSAWLARRSSRTGEPPVILEVDPDHKITIRLGASGGGGKGEQISGSETQAAIEEVLKTATSLESS